MFGSTLDLAESYAELLCTTGIEHGLIGPRETERIWERHLLNCAVMAPMVPDRARVADVGSGAGLPGLVLAILRPDLSMTLIEPLERRVRWLTHTIEVLGLEGVTVVRARADEVPDQFDVVTARAVAALPTLARWCLPLTAPGGVVLALKGSSARSEIERSRRDLVDGGASSVEVEECGVGVVDPVTTVVVLRPRPRPPRSGRPTRRPGSAGPQRKR